MIWNVILVVMPTFQLSNGITGERAKPPETEKGFMVYLTKASMAHVDYDAWICGGTLVSKMDIITSAACIEDVKYMYAIAGYRKYVRNDKLKTDMCVRNGRKKVVLTCVPKNYNFSYDKIDRWSGIDIGVARVESEYDFTKTVPGCSYAPSAIEVNYDLRFQEEGKEGFILGWGHREIWRNKDDKKDYNNETLLGASTTIINKDVCLEIYKRPPKLRILIQRFMICANGTGTIDSDGNPEHTNNNSTYYGVDQIGPNGCGPDKLRHGGYPECKNVHAMRNGGNETDSWSVTRRAGICQNDHGGPLVAHIGSKDKLIGVASVFRINKEKHCVGPYLYTSTACSAAFLRCILDKILYQEITPSPITSDKALRGIEDCNLSLGFGFSIDQRSISWREHPDGPAANEVIDRNPENESLLKDRNNIYQRRPVVNAGPQTNVPRNKFRPQIMISNNGSIVENNSDLVFRPQRPIKG